MTQHPPPHPLAQTPETTEELLQKAHDYLVQIGVFLSAHAADLPAEIRRHRNHFSRVGTVAALLAVHLAHDTLHDFFARHAACRAMVGFVYAGRFPRLLEGMLLDDEDGDGDGGRLRRALVAADGTSSDQRPKILGGGGERRRRGGGGDGDGGGGGGGWAWVPRSTTGVHDHDHDDSSRNCSSAPLPFTVHQHLALQAFRDFQTEDDEPRLPPSARGKFLSRSQLAALERRVMTAPAPAPARARAKDGNETTTTTAQNLPVGTYLTFTLPPRSSSPELENAPRGKKRAAESDEENKKKKKKKKEEQEQEQEQGERLMHYKGVLIDGPTAMLRKIKTYLSAPAVQQQDDQGIISVERLDALQEYLGYLLQIRGGGGGGTEKGHQRPGWADPGRELDEAVDMLRACALYTDFHRAFPGLDHEPWEHVMRPLYKVRGPGHARDEHGMAGNNAGGAAAGVGCHDGGQLPVTFDGMMISEAPADGARDPFAYTRWHNRLRDNLAAARAQTRDMAAAVVAARKTEQQRKMEKGGEGGVGGVGGEKRDDEDDGEVHVQPLPIVDVPRSRNGPVSAAMLMDVEMRKIMSDRRRLTVLQQALARLARQDPRPLLEEMVGLMEMGHDHDSDDDDGGGGNGNNLVAPPKKKAFVRLQNDELRWLDYICQPSLHGKGRRRRQRQKQQLADEDDGNDLDDWKADKLRQRLKNILRPMIPDAFADGLVALDSEALLRVINSECHGAPVAMYRFTMADLKRNLPELVESGILEETNNVPGNRKKWRRSVAPVHPEMAIRWTVSNSAKRKRHDHDDGDGDGDAPVPVPAPAPVDNIDMDQYAKPMSSHDMPDMDRLRSVTECLRERDDVVAATKEALRTRAMFHRLAYRLGRTLRDVDVDARRNLHWLAENRRKRSRNALLLEDGLRAVVAQWDVCAGDVRVPVCRGGGGLVVATYRDVVRAAGDGDGDGAETEAHCRELVRRNLLREASLNNTMLWPLPVAPRDTDIVVHVVGDGKDQRQQPPTLRREAVWSFAHPAKRALVPRFWNVNRWPPSSSSTR